LGPRVVQTQRRDLGRSDSKRACPAGGDGDSPGDSLGDGEGGGLGGEVGGGLGGDGMEMVGFGLGEGEVEGDGDVDGLGTAPFGLLL
jgi:hypothetical protein